MRITHSLRSFREKRQIQPSLVPVGRNGAGRRSALIGRSHSCLLQFDRLVVEALGQFHARLRRPHVRLSPQATLVLRNHQQQHLLADREPLRFARFSPLLRRLPPAPERQVEHRYRELWSGLKHREGAGVLFPASETLAQECLQVEPLRPLRRAELHLRQQCRAGDCAVLVGLGHA